jgi:transketolase
MDKVLQRDVFIEYLTEKAKSDPDIYFVSADMGAESLDAFREQYPKRFVYTGIAEQNTINVTAGLAHEGKKVFVYAMASFYARCYEQIRYSLGMMNLPCTLIGNGVGLGYEDSGPAHYTVDDVGLMRLIHGMRIYTPHDGTTTRQIVKSLVDAPLLSYVRLERRPVIDEVYGKNYPSLSLDRGWEELKTGDLKTCLVGSGYSTNIATEVHAKLLENGISVGLIDVFRNDIIYDLPVQYDTAVVIEEQSPVGSTAEMMITNDICPDIIPYNLPQRYIFENGGRGYLHKLSGIDADTIVKAMLWWYK